MTAEEHKATLRRVYEAFGAGVCGVETVSAARSRYAASR
jgi:hypothetical protein